LSKVSTSVLIAVGPNHFGHIQSTVDNIMGSSYLPDEIIFGLNYPYPKEVENYIKTFKLKKGIPIKFLKVDFSSYPLKIRSMNNESSICNFRKSITRHELTLAAQSKLLLFQDVDDLIHPRRIEVAVKTYEETSYDMMYHSFIQDFPHYPDLLGTDLYDFNKHEVTEEDHKTYFPNRKLEDGLVPGWFGAKIWKSVCTGAMVYTKKSYFNEWWVKSSDEIVIAEDYDFAIKCLFKKKKILLTDAKLYCYGPKEKPIFEFNRIQLNLKDIINE
jgi:hypothetical protein